MSITIPPELDWVVKIAAGQSWPQADEDRLSEQGDVWYGARDQLAAVNHELASVAGGLRDALSGPTAEQFDSYVKQLNDSMPVMVGTAGSLGDMSKETAVQTQYSKLMILLQLIWMAEQIIEWSSTIWGLAVVPEIEAVGRFVIWQIAKRFAMSVVSATAIQTGMDALVQAFQMFVLKDRTHWDTSNTVGAVEMGALAGGVGGAVHEIAHLIAPDLSKQLAGRLVVAGTSGVVTGVVGNFALGAGQDLGLAFASGAAGGLFAGRGGHGGHEPPPVETGGLHDLAALAKEAADLGEKHPDDLGSIEKFSGDPKPPPGGGGSGHGGLPGFESGPRQTDNTTTGGELHIPSRIDSMPPQERADAHLAAELNYQAAAASVHMETGAGNGPAGRSDSAQVLQERADAHLAAELNYQAAAASVQMETRAGNGPAGRSDSAQVLQERADAHVAAQQRYQDAVATEPQVTASEGPLSTQEQRSANADRLWELGNQHAQNQLQTGAPQALVTQQIKDLRQNVLDAGQDVAVKTSAERQAFAQSVTADAKAATANTRYETAVQSGAQDAGQYKTAADVASARADAAARDATNAAARLRDAKTGLANARADLVQTEASGGAVGQNAPHDVSRPDTGQQKLGTLGTSGPPKVVTLRDLTSEPDTSAGHGGSGTGTSTDKGLLQPRSEGSQTQTIVEPQRGPDRGSSSVGTSEIGHAPAPHEAGRPDEAFPGTGQQLGGTGHVSESTAQDPAKAAGQAALARAAEARKTQAEPSGAPSVQPPAKATTDTAARNGSTVKTTAEPQAPKDVAATKQTTAPDRQPTAQKPQRTAEPPPTAQDPTRTPPARKTAVAGPGDNGAAHRTATAAHAGHEDSAPAPKTPAAPHEDTTAHEPPRPEYTPAEREEAWQKFLDEARERYPGSPPTREPMTWAQATDWVDRQVDQRIREAQGAYWDPFDTAAARQYVEFHAAQAHDDAWAMLMHDLGVKVPPGDATALGGTSGSGHDVPVLDPKTPSIVLTPPDGHSTVVHEAGPDPTASPHSTTPHTDQPSIVVTSPDDKTTLLHAGTANGAPPPTHTEPHADVPAIVVTSPAGEHTLVQSAGGHEPPPVVRLTTPKDTVAHTQAVAAVPRAVGWKTLVAHYDHGAVVDGGRKVGGAELAGRLGVGEGGFDGVVMVVCDAAVDLNNGPAAGLHRASGGSMPVLAPTREAMIGPDGDVLSGIWHVNEHLETVPNPVGHWVLWKDGVPTRLATSSLNEALDLLGVQHVAGGTAPDRPVSFYNQLTETQRATLDNLRYSAGDVHAARGPDSFYQSLIDAAGQRIRQLIGQAPDLSPGALRNAVADALHHDLGQPDSHYAHLVTGGRTPNQVVGLVRDPQSWSHQEDLLVPHVAADLLGLHLGVVGPQGRAEAVGDPTAPHRGDINGDPHLIVNVGDGYVAAHPDQSPPDPTQPQHPRELQPARSPQDPNPWVAPFTPRESARIDQAVDSVPVPPEADAARVQAIQTHVLGHQAPLSDHAAAAQALKEQVKQALTAWGEPSSTKTLNHLNSLERIQDAYTSAEAAIAQRTTALQNDYLAAAYAAGHAADATATANAHTTANIVAETEHVQHVTAARDTATTPPRPDGIEARLQQIHDNAVAAGQRAADDQIQQALNAVPPRSRFRDTPAIVETTPEGERSTLQQAITQEQRHLQAMADARQAARANAERAREQAFRASIDHALADPALARHLGDLTHAIARHDQAAQNRSGVRDARQLGDAAHAHVEQTVLAPLQNEVRAVTAWNIREANALADLRASLPHYHLPPGFGERGPDGAPQYPMGRRGQFVRFGDVRLSDHVSLADMAVRAVGAGLPRALRADLHAAVMGFLAEHGDHEFTLRLLDSGLDFTVGTGDGRHTVHLALDLGDLDLAHHPAAGQAEKTPLGQKVGVKVHHPVEADHESTSGGGRSISNNRSLGITGNVATAFGGLPHALPNRVFSATVGLGISASSSRSHSFSEAAVSATKRLFEISGQVTYFDIPGAQLAAIVSQHGHAPAAPQHTQLKVRVSFPVELAPLKPDDAPVSAMMHEPLGHDRPHIGITDLDALHAEAPNGPLHQAAQRVADAQHHFFNQVESVSGLGALRTAVTSRLGGGNIDHGLAEGVDFYLGEGSVMRMFGDMTGPGSTSPLFVSTDGKRAMHLTVSGDLRNAQRVSQSKVGLKEESQRFISLNEGTAEGGSASLTLPTVSLGHTFGDLTAPTGGNTNLSVSGSVTGTVSSSRGTNANTGSGHISGLVYNGISVLYRTTFHMDVQIATNDGRPHAPVGQDVTVFLRVPLHEAPRFEKMLEDQGSLTPQGPTAWPKDVDKRSIDPELDAAAKAAEALERGRERHPPLALAAGQGTGFTAISHMAGSEKVLPELVQLIQQHDAPMAWSRPWDAMETAYLRTQLASRYTREGLINWGTALFQDGGVRMQITRPAKEGVEVITVTVRGRYELPPNSPANTRPTPFDQGRNSSVKLEIFPSAFAGNGGSDTLGHGLSVSAQASASGGIHIDEPTRTIGGNIAYGYNRNKSNTLNVGASGFMLESILYSGPARTFDYRVAFDLEVSTHHQKGLNPVDWTALTPKVMKNLFGGRAPVFASAPPVQRTLQNGHARFVIVEKLAPLNPIDPAHLAQVGVPQRLATPRPHPQPARELGDLFRRSPQPPAVQVVTPPKIQPHLQGGVHVPLHADDQVTDVLGGAHLAQEITRLLDQLGVPKETYRNTPWLMTSTETLAASQVRGPSEMRQTLFVGGAFADERVDITLTGFPHNMREGDERVPIFQMHVAEGNGSVSSSSASSSSHSVRGTLNLGITDHTDNSATQTSSPSWSFSKNFGDKASSHSSSLTPTSGRLTQGTRDYVENTAHMLWRVSVVVRKENMVLNGDPISAHALINVPSGISFLRYADPVHDPRGADGALTFPQPPPQAVPMLRTDQRPRGSAPISPYGDTGLGAHEIPTLPATPGSAKRLPTVPLLPGPAVSDRIMPAPQPHHIGDALPTLEVTGEGNPVLDAVQSLLQRHAPGMLDGYWTAQEARGNDQLPAPGPNPGPVRRVPAKLSNLLNVGSMEALIDLMLGPGLILTGTRSLPLFNERIQIVLRATRDPNGHGFAWVRKSDMNVSNYNFRLNAELNASNKSAAHSASTAAGPLVRDAPAHNGRFANASVGFGLTASSAVNAGHSLMKTDASRDTFFAAGRADQYVGELMVNVSIAKTVMPSRLTNSASLGAARKIAGVVQGVGNPVRGRPNIDVPMLERVLIPRQTVTDDMPPPANPGDVAVRQVAVGSTAASLGHTPFAITKDDLLRHDVVNFGFDHAKLRVLADEALQRFSGTFRPESFAVSRLVDENTRSLHAITYMMSHPMLTRQLEFMLTDAGLKSPTLWVEGGPFTDTSGHLTIKVELANPHVRGYSGGEEGTSTWNESVDYGFREFNRNESKSTNQSLNVNAGTAQTSGDLAPGQPPNSHSHQTPGDSISATVGRTVNDNGFAVLKTMPRYAAWNRNVPWLRVNADAIFTLELDARNTGDLIDLPGGKVTATFLVKNALELGVSPETALHHGLVHPHGLTIPSGVFASAHGALATHGVPDHSVDALRAAYDRPGNNDHFFVHVKLNADGNFIVGNRALTPNQFREQVLAGRNLDGRTVVLVAEGGDEAALGAQSAAEHLVWLTGRPVLATAGELHITRDSAIHAHTGAGRPAGNIPVGAPAQWTLLTPHGLEIVRTDHGSVLDHALIDIARLTSTRSEPSSSSGPSTQHGAPQARVVPIYRAIVDDPGETAAAVLRRQFSDALLGGNVQEASRLQVLLDRLAVARGTEPAVPGAAKRTDHGPVVDHALSDIAARPTGARSEPSSPSTPSKQSDPSGRPSSSAPHPLPPDSRDSRQPVRTSPRDVDVAAADEELTNARIALRKAEEHADQLQDGAGPSSGAANRALALARRRFQYAYDRAEEFGLPSSTTTTSESGDSVGHQRFNAGNGKIDKIEDQSAITPHDDHLVASHRADELGALPSTTPRADAGVPARHSPPHQETSKAPVPPIERPASASPHAEVVKVPMSAASLDHLARTVRGWLGSDANRRADEGELPASDCVALLLAFTKALHPGDPLLVSGLSRDLHGGARPQRAVDDSVIGAGGDGERLAPGARWRKVDSWQTVAETVEAAGHGATALVLWQRRTDTGHAFGAHNTTDGVRWLEIGADDGHQVLESAPARPAAHARYVVIDAAGRVINDGLPAASESESTARAIIDAPLRADYGKIGAELETHWLLTSPQELSHGDRLFGNRHVELVAEQLSGDAPVSLEFVGRPINLPGEVGGISERDFWRSFEYAFHRLRESTPLPWLFGRQDDIRGLDYPNTSLGTVEEGKELALSPQWTVGMPATEMLDWLVGDIRRMSVQSTGSAHADAETGAELGKLVAARYFAAQYGQELGIPHVAWELLDDPEYRSVGGSVALVFMQAVTAAHGADDKESGKPIQTWFKNYTFAASRHDPAQLSRGLSPAVRDFLDRNADTLMADFAEHVSLNLSGNYHRDPMNAGFDIPGLRTVRQYVNSFLKLQPDRTVAQKDLGVLTTFAQLDGDKVLVELRDLADVHDVPEARQQYDALKARVQARYADAQRRAALDAAHHAAQRSLLSAIDNDPRIGALERVLSLAGRLNALHPQRAHGFELLDRPAVRDLVHSVVGMAAPQRMTSHLGDRATAAQALRQLDGRLEEFGLTLNLLGDPAWDLIKRDWGQGMRDVATLRQALTGEPGGWPPQDVTQDWRRFSALPGLASRSSLKGIDTAVRDAIARPGDPATLRAVLDRINVWRDDVMRKPNSSAARRAPAVHHLERLVLHKLADAPEPGGRPAHGGRSGSAAQYPVPAPEGLARWTERFESARDYLDGRPDRARLVERAEQIVLAHHVAPPQASAGLSPREAEYQRTYSDIVNVIASLLGRDQGLSAPEARAQRIVQELVRDLGTGLSATVGGGARGRGASGSG